MTDSPVTPATASRRGAVLPARITRGTVVLAVASLISQMGIVVTGGAVRLTASGLGCPTWPMCRPGSLTNTPEMGIHGYIEFGNRTLTGVLSVISLLMILWLWKVRHVHREAFRLSMLLLAGIAVQALIGGATVLLALDPRIVGVHFVISALLIVWATQLLLRVRHARRHPAGTPVVDGATTRISRAAATVNFIALWFTLVLGTLVTGTGPHSGDPQAARHGFDALLITRAHVVPVYVMVIATLVLLVAVHRTPGTSPAQRRTPLFALAAVVLQGAIGYWQHLTGLPIGVVALHLAGATITTVAATVAWQRQTSDHRVPAADTARA